MRILIASDLHYRLKQLDWLAAQASGYDAVVIAGDTLDISSSLDLDVQILVMQKSLKRISDQTTLLVCSGNHDGNEKNRADEFIAPWLQQARNPRVYVDGDNVWFDTTLFTIFPWWDGEVTRAEVAVQLERASVLESDQWIWIYHAPPDNSPTSWTGKRHIGDAALNDWIAQYHPDVVLTGHIHESPFKRDGSWVDQIGGTWVFNAGSHIGEVPAHIVLDLDSMQAQWYSLAGTDQRQLA